MRCCIRFLLPYKRRNMEEQVNHNEENGESEEYGGSDEWDRQSDENSPDMVQVEDPPTEILALEDGTSDFSNVRSLTVLDDGRSSWSARPVEDAAVVTVDETVSASEHSYLPGTSHPLFPESLLDRRRRMRSSSFNQPSIEGRNKRIRNVDGFDGGGAGTLFCEGEDSLDDSRIDRSGASRRLVELPILELNDVVFFPGSTIPIRLRNPDWIDYLGRRIDAARGIGGRVVSDEEVRMGILTYVDPRPARVQQQRQRNSWMRTAIRLRGADLANLLPEAEEIDNAAMQDPLLIDTNENDRRTRRLPVPRRHEDTSNRSERPPVDPLIGRIGTVATITYTHEDTAGDVVDAGDSRYQESRVWQRNEGQIVVTALGTGRFRIVSCLDGGADGGSLRQRSRSWGDMATVRLYHVEELPDEELPLPPAMIRRKLTSAPVASEADVPFLIHHEQIVQNLSLFSPIEHFAYRSVWPWRLVGLIRSALDRIPGFEGLRKGLPSLPGNLDDGVIHDTATADYSRLDPKKFSFWLASNMPLSAKEKLDLLQMDCTVKRLRFIYNKVLEQERRERAVCCKMCGKQLSRISSMFTVGGAEGTTGAYVNEYGMIHQTITLREVEESSVWLSGGPETKDSWFPGYSWTIAYCNRCRSHLGWKFLLVRRNSESPGNDGDRPAMFWGLSGGSVTTQTASYRLEDE